ncbi:cilia- and flagella-associated protein 53 [Microcaecilia unicolor]|uniref:Cilia- and flagella-associated protein 53 n=1 Tax=Microcaecilia unicolor TaxID=1415580 RepID=A0A6P7X5Q7_9AMPH|nr:cilia- and flagella-associated protein 53 [Microcaecilia unicolor]
MLARRQRQGPRCREVPGTKPHSVSIRAKLPSSRTGEAVLYHERKRELQINSYKTVVKQNKWKDVVSQWELLTDHKVIHNTTQRKVHEAMQQYRMGTDERRQRLRELLEAEEKELIKEMESMEETTLERQAKMRERAKYLRDRREQERLKLVDIKLDQLFREQSEELRSLLIKNTQNQVCAERKAQLLLKGEIQRQQKEEEQLFAELWEKDRLAKEKHEEENAQRRKELNKGMLDNLDLQSAAVEAQKAEAKRLKEEEAQLMEEERRLLKMEEERALMEKRQKQQQTRDVLDNCVRLKMKRLNKAQQEELALDMKILDQLLHETSDDTQEKLQRKLELKKEQQIYREYLAQQLEEEKRQEKEMEKLVEADMKRAWAKQAEQRRREREARNRLMKEVLDTRWLQLKEKLERNAEEQKDLIRDKELLEKAMEEYKQSTMETTARQLKRAKDYQGDLLSQITYQQLQRDFEKADEWREYEEGLLAEKAYQAKLKEILSRPYADENNVHPLRHQCTSILKDEHPAK